MSSVGVQAALGTALVPLVTVAEAEEGAEAELQLDDDPGAAVRLDTDGCPLIVSVAQVACHFLAYAAAACHLKKKGSRRC